MRRTAPTARVWTSLTAEALARHGDELAEAGFTVVRAMTPDDAWLAEARARIDELLAREGDGAGSEFAREDGAPRLSDLVNKGEVFDRAWRDAWLHALVARVVPEPFVVDALNFRDAAPGRGAQELHADKPDPAWRGVSSIWAIDAFTADNGATRVVPGTHRVGVERMPPDRRAPHPRERVVACPAGSVIVYDVRLWHGGTRNASGARRRALHCSFCARRHPQQLDQRRYLRAETRARLPPADLALLGADGGPGSTSQVDGAR